MLIQPHVFPHATNPQPLSIFSRNCCMLLCFTKISPAIPISANMGQQYTLHRKPVYFPIQRRWPSESACLPEWKLLRGIYKGKAPFSHINLGLWLGFTDARLLGLRVRILSAAWMHLSCLWSLLSSSGFSFTRQRKPQILPNLIFFLNSEVFETVIQQKIIRVWFQSILQNIFETLIFLIFCLSVRLDAKFVGLHGTTSSFAKFYVWALWGNVDKYLAANAALHVVELIRTVRKLVSIEFNLWRLQSLRKDLYSRCPFVTKTK